MEHLELIKVKYLDFFQWHWKTDPPNKWHKSFIFRGLFSGHLDFILFKDRIIYVRGMCFHQAVFDEWLDLFRDGRLSHGSYDVREIENCKISVPLLIPDRKSVFWDIERGYQKEFYGAEPLDLSFKGVFQKVLPSRVVDGFSDFGGNNAEQLTIFDFMEV